MKSLMQLIIVTSALLFSQYIQAGTLTIPASSGNYFSTTTCANVSSKEGTIRQSPVGGDFFCTVLFDIPLESGKTINSITFYYYDNTDSQYITGYVTKTSLSTDSYSVISNFSDTTTSSSVQFKTLNINTILSSSYTYSVFVELSYATELRGIKVSYQ